MDIDARFSCRLNISGNNSMSSEFEVRGKMSDVAGCKKEKRKIHDNLNPNILHLILLFYDSICVMTHTRLCFSHIDRETEHSFSFNDCNKICFSYHKYIEHTAIRAMRN